MSFKLFFDNQMNSFEKFYLKNDLFVADAFEYGMKKDENLDFFIRPEFKTARAEELHHVFRVRTPTLNDNTVKEVREKATLEETKGFQKDHVLGSFFSIPNGFFRKPSKDYSNYFGRGESFYNGEKINTGVIFNSRNRWSYKLKDFFLFNFIFGFFRDKFS